MTTATRFPCGHPRTTGNTQFLGLGQRACRTCRSADTFPCGHPHSAENDKPNGRGGVRCRQCSQAHDRTSIRKGRRAMYKRHKGGGVREPVIHLQPEPELVEASREPSRPRRFSWETKG